MMRRIFSVTAAAVILGAGLVATPATAADDSAVLALDAKLSTTLKKGAVKTSALKPAKLKATTFTFPAAPADSSIALSGGMSMVKGKSAVKLRRIVVNPGGGTVDAEVHLKDSSQPQPMSLPVPGLMRISGGDNQLTENGTWTGATVKLAKSVTITGNKWDPAKLLGDTLGVKLKKGATFGKITITMAQ